MIDCLIMGDSIAVGVSQQRPECSVQAVVGITSKKWNITYNGQKHEAKTAIISLSTNDFSSIDTRRELTDLRKQVIAEKVFWVMPARFNGVFHIVQTIASENGDKFLISAHLSPDGIHPTTKGYRLLAEQTK